MALEDGKGEAGLAIIKYAVGLDVTTRWFFLLEYNFIC